MDTTLDLAAQEYLDKREQMGARKAATHVIQTYGVTALALSEYLRDHGMLLAQRSTSAITAASEVHYLGEPSGARTGRMSVSKPNLSQAP